MMTSGIAKFMPVELHGKVNEINPAAQQARTSNVRIKFCFIMLLSCNWTGMVTAYIFEVIGK